jgi:PBP1b-binding outer membrane lipoprotein LpoB
MSKRMIVASILIVCIAFTGCAKNRRTEYCDPLLAKFDKIYISALDTESVIDEFGAGTSTLKGITNAINEELENKIREGRHFQIMARGDEGCQEGAIKIENKLAQIKYQVKGSQHRITNDVSISSVKGKYDILVTSNVISCTTGEPIYSFETKDRDRDLLDLSRELGRDIANAINKKANECD